jgi:hypothetical protein
MNQSWTEVVTAVRNSQEAVGKSRGEISIKRFEVWLSNCFRLDRESFPLRRT